MAKNVKLKERGTNETMYPITNTDQVLLKESYTLTKKLSELDTQLASPIDWSNVNGGDQAIENALDWYEE